MRLSQSGQSFSSNSRFNPRTKIRKTSSQSARCTAGFQRCPCLLWVSRVGPTQATASPDVRSTSNSVRISAAQGSDASCHLRRFALRKNSESFCRLRRTTLWHFVAGSGAVHQKSKSQAIYATRATTHVPALALARGTGTTIEADHVHFRRATIARPITQSLSLSLRKLSSSVNWLIHWR